MASRSVISRDDISSLEQELIEIDIENEELTVLEPERVAIRSMIPARTKWRSPKTGEVYLWERAGAEVKVLIDDVEFLLNHKRGGSCCGATRQASFELVE
jgi:hypothetical protein